MDAIRGRDSTGILRVDALGKPTIVKDALPSDEFLKRPNVLAQTTQLERALFAVGHNRYATRGRINPDNAHPFQHKHISLVHNGSLFTKHGLPDGHRFEVDSEAITHSIAEIGIQETTKKLDGAYSLVWYDENQGTLNFCRNKERPMVFVFVEDGMFFGSEGPMIEWVLWRCGIKVEAVVSTKPLVHYEFKERCVVPKEEDVTPYFFQAGKWTGNTTTLPATVDNVAWFKKGKKAGGSPPLTTDYPQDKPVFFSIVDFVATSAPRNPTGECHMRVTGINQDWGYPVTCEGMIFATESELMYTTNLMVADINKYHVDARKEITKLLLKNLRISDLPDPEFEKVTCGICYKQAYRTSTQQAVYKGRQETACMACAQALHLIEKVKGA